jgi:nucleoside-diphosphate-sugar epimerase
MKALVTGSAGFVGRHFIPYLTSRGYSVTEIDIKNGVDCRDFFRNSSERFDLVVHLAAIVGGRATIEGEPLSVATDLSIDAEMFNWALKTRPEKVIYYSSSAAYPTQLQSHESGSMLHEDMINLEAVQNPDESYGWAKLTGELLANYARKAGIKVYVFRPFSGYGPDQDLNYPFPSFLKRVLDRVDEFEIWGDGSQVRDFIHIDDVVEGTMAFVDRDIYDPVNLGWGRPTSFNELAEIFFEIADWRPKNGIKHLLEKPKGVMYRCSNNSRMLKIFVPRISLEQGIKSALEVGFNEHS